MFNLKKQPFFYISLAVHVYNTSIWVAPWVRNPAAIPMDNEDNNLLNKKLTDSSI